jgi:hypothetical protein
MKGILLLLPFQVACASSYMTDTEPLGQPSPDQAKVVLFRTVPVAMALTFPIYDGTELLGFSEYGTYFECFRKPGPHFFVAWGESDGIVEADLAGGKTYFLEFFPTWGFFKTGAGLAPVPAQSEKGAKMEGILSGLKCRQLIPERQASWMERHQDKAVQKEEHAQEKAPENRAYLRPGDGK